MTNLFLRMSFPPRACVVTIRLTVALGFHATPRPSRDITSSLCSFAIPPDLWQEDTNTAGRSHGKTLELLWNCCGMDKAEKEQGESVVTFGAYRLHQGEGRLWRGKQEVKLTPKAFATLSYFVARPGQLVTKEDLFAAVWRQTVVGEATLTSYIQELRQALRDAAKKPRYIETVHRRGY